MAQATAAVAANKVQRVRAALAWDEENAQLARLHNNAQIVCIGARMTEAPELRTRIVDILLTARFSPRPRHSRRVGDGGTPLRG